MNRYDEGGIDGPLDNRLESNQETMHGITGWDWIIHAISK